MGQMNLPIRTNLMGNDGLANDAIPRGGLADLRGVHLRITKLETNLCELRMILLRTDVEALRTDGMCQKLRQGFFDTREGEEVL